MEASATRNEEVVKNDGLIQPRYPVYTTTDSNLLEGKWTFVFSSAKPAKVLMDARFSSIGYKPTNRLRVKLSTPWKEVSDTLH
jgi:hypothetical protein